jgi:hypothetical protein
MLGVVSQVEPPIVPATIQAGQSHRYVVVATALLRQKVGASDRRRVGAVAQAGEPEEVLEQMPLCADAKEPLAHRFKSNHMLDVVQVEVLKLQPVREQHPADKLPAGTEKPRSWKTMNDTTYPLKGRGMDSSAGTIHSTASVRGGS